jgi:enamine deaminase RidA (YjgF/YER057c/UK114 family)
MSAEQRLTALPWELPPAPQPMGVYRPIVVVENLAYLSGHGPLLPDGSLMTGRVGDEITQETGYQAARQTGLAILATLREALGSLDRVAQTVKLFGMVNCVAGFKDQPAVINGCSELMIDVFGEQHGVGARSAVGVAALPGHMSVEIEAIFRVA